MSDRFDVVVVGAGPAGIAAACRAAESGARVLVLDDNLAAGGQIWRGEQSEPWLQRFTRSGAALETSSAVFDERVLQRGRAVILATGARELFLPFPGWTLPGVTGAGGLQALIKGGLDVTGKRVVVAGSGPLLSVVASLAREKGASVMLVAEQAPAARVRQFVRGLWRHPAKLAQGAGLALSLLGAAHQFGCWVEQATGDGFLQRALVRRGRTLSEEPCDLLALGFGLIPNVELAQLLGCHLNEAFVSTGDWQQTSVEGIYAAGELTGIGGVDKAIVEGEIAGLAAANRHAGARALFPRRARCREFAGALKTTFALRDEVKQLARPDTLICRCEDVPLSDLRAHAAWREAKLQTRCGMGACQGRVCGAITRALWGWGPGTPRPPLFPVPIGDLMKSRSS